MRGLLIQHPWIDKVLCLGGYQFATAKKPVRYRHPSSAVIWAVLSKAVERAVRSNLD